MAQTAKADSFPRVGPGVKVLVLGLGRSGQAAAELAHALGAAVVALDEKESPSLQEYRHAQAANFAVELGWADLPLPAADLAVISPGLSPASPLRRGRRVDKR